MAAASDTPVTIGVPRETAPGERRVALTPETARKLATAGARIRIERGAGLAAGFTDEAYAETGAEPGAEIAHALDAADIVLCVQPPAPAQHLRGPRRCL